MEKLGVLAANKKSGIIWPKKMSPIPPAEEKQLQWMTKTFIAWIQS
jgi:hypothetical protein